ncbi:MAG: DUF58 domain-containing protein [Chloroflexi bacterium]|nr:MAG: DUF58 domain-containing protein [Chloroflexota bacterium]
MRGNFLLSLIAYTLILFGLLSMNGPLVGLSLIYVIYLAISYLSAPRNIRIDATRTISTRRVSTNTPCEVTISVANTGSTLEAVLFEEALPTGLKVQEGALRHIFHIPAGKTVTWKYTINGSRGYYTFEEIIAKARDPLWMSSREEKASANGQLFILPPVLRLKNLSIRPRRTRVYSGIVPARTGGPGIEFFDVREYQTGDPLRWINWRLSARYPSTWFTKEYEQERVADVGIILDGRLSANLISENKSIFEYSALAAAAVSGTFLAQGNRVGLLVYGQFIQWTFPGYGRVQRERILRALALARLGTSQVFSHLEYIPTRLFPSHSQLILISPLVADDPDVIVRLRSRGYKIVLISPDPVSFEASYLPDAPEFKQAERIIRMQRELMLEKIRHAGIQVVDWNVSTPFDQVMNQHFRRLPVLPERTGGRK